MDDEQGQAELRAMIVDCEEWIPERSTVPALARTANEEGAGGWIRSVGLGGPEHFLLLVEQVAFLAAGERAKVIIARDQIATFDPTFVEVRDDAGQVRFPDMTAPFALRRVEEALAVAAELGLEARGGCIVGLPAPELLTPAERTAIQRLGGDAVCRRMHREARWAVALGGKSLAIGVDPCLASGDLRDFIGLLLRTRDG